MLVLHIHCTVLNFEIVIKIARERFVTFQQDFLELNKLLGQNLFEVYPFARIKHFHTPNVMYFKVSRIVLSICGCAIDIT